MMAYTSSQILHSLADASVKFIQKFGAIDKNVHFSRLVH